MLPTLFLLIFAATTALAANGDIVSRSPCTLPAGNPASERFVCERIVYRSGELAVSAYLYRPADTTGPLPVVVYNRGGYVVQDVIAGLLPTFEALAEAGFLVIAPMYRGSDGTEGHDEMGGADVADLQNVIPLLRNVRGADLRNIFLFGESRGGVMSFIALREGFPARAAATVGAFTDLAEYIRGDPRVQASVTTVWPDYATNTSEINRTRSAIHWVDGIRVPLLLMHGGADRQVSPAQTLTFVQKLQQAGREYSLVVFAGDSHVISSNRGERDRLVIRWFKKHVYR